MNKNLENSEESLIPWKKINELNNEESGESLKTKSQNSSVADINSVKLDDLKSNIIKLPNTDKSNELINNTEILEGTIPLKPKHHRKDSSNQLIAETKSSNTSNQPSEIFSVKPNRSEESFRYAVLIKEDADFKLIAADMENNFSSEENPKEKLRVASIILKNLTEEEEQYNLLEKFFALTERHYQKLFYEFGKTNQKYKPAIKLLQILDLLIEKFKDEKTRKEILDRIYKSFYEKEMLTTDWRFLRKLCEQREGPNIEIFSFWREHLVKGFLRRIEKTKRVLLWKNETEGIKYVKEIIDFISNLSEERLFKFLLKGRFEKAETGSFSVIVGDEGGLFLLMNSVPPGSRQERCVLEAGVSEDFLREKRGKFKNSVILGEGGFGKARLALSILGTQKVDIGQLVCVKKSKYIGSKKFNEIITLKNITDSILNDFFSRKLNDSIYAPTSIDMAILTSNLNDKKHMKGYFIMDLVPENTADKIFLKQKYQKWEYQKPYILAVMKAANDLLLNDRVFNSDLKPPNTLFDPLSRKTAIIDLGSSLLIKRDQNIEEFDASAGGFGVSEPYCFPEIKEESQLKSLNLKKAISYICGITIGVVIYGSTEIKRAKKENDWNMTAINTDLDEHSNKLLIDTIKGLTEKSPASRLDLKVAIETIENIGLNADEIMKKATTEQYIEKVRKVAKENPSVLSLNEDINDTIKKGIIEQLVVENNPQRYQRQNTKQLNKELDDFLNDEKEDDNLLVLLGEAGSGKSLALQMRFLREVEEWEYGKKALPLFFNMADEVDLVRAISRINAILGCNIKIEVPNEEIHLFIDSYDEGRHEEIVKSTKQEEKSEESEKQSIIHQYFEKLSKWRRRKIVVSCRTDFVQGEGDDNISEFQVTALEGLSVRYIAPINYEKARTIKNENNLEKRDRYYNRNNNYNQCSNVNQESNEINEHGHSNENLSANINIEANFEHNLLKQKLQINNENEGRNANSDNTLIKNSKLSEDFKGESEEVKKENNDFEEEIYDGEKRNENSKDLEFGFQVSKWLKREYINLNAEDILKKIK